MMKNELLNKLSVAACALLLAGSITACGGEETPDGPCADGEELVQLGGMEQCIKRCPNGVSDCAMGQVCRQISGTPICREDTSACPAGQINSTYQGSTQCRVDCASDAALCTGDQQCVDADAGARVCATPPAPACDEGEVETVFEGGTRQCYQTCTDDTSCDGENVCASDDANANMICVPPDPNIALCADYCSALYGECALNNCGGLTDMQKTQLAELSTLCLEGNGAALAPCVDRLAANAEERAQATRLVEAGCDSTIVKLNQCATQFTENGPTLDDACGCAVTDYTQGCATDADCESTLPSVCLPEDATTQVPPGGLCVATGCHEFFATPPTGNTVGFGFEDLCGGTRGACLASVNATTMAVTSQCIEACINNSECGRGVTGADDSGYSCGVGASFGGGSYLGRCRPACTTDADCLDDSDPQNPVQGVCGNTRVCEPACDPASMNMGNTQCSMDLPGSSCVQNTRDETKFSCALPQSAFSTGM